jgi:nucleoside-triphosphatase
MHLFLTGDPGCGKSTVVNKLLARTAARVGGFRTGFGSDRTSACRSLYLWPAWEEPQWDNAHTVAEFSQSGVTPLPGRFDALGCAALVRPDTELLIMDECGRLEQEALSFQSAILTALDGKIPILGVVRQGLPGWTAAVAAHPAVELITVTQANRDRLPACLIAWLER